MSTATPTDSTLPEVVTAASLLAALLAERDARTRLELTLERRVEAAWKECNEQRERDRTAASQTTESHMFSRLNTAHRVLAKNGHQKLADLLDYILSNLDSFAPSKQKMKTVEELLALARAASLPATVDTTT